MNYTCFYYIEKQLFSFSIKILESEKIYLDNQCGILGKGNIWKSLRLKFLFLIDLAAPDLSCSIQDLVP